MNTLLPRGVQRSVPAVPAELDIHNTNTRVLVIDDHELVRRGLAALINDESDMACCGESTCLDAIAAIQRHRPEVVVVDVSIARGGGFKLIQQIRALDAGIRIVALAMSDKPEFVEQTFSAGAAACVMKMDLAARVLTAIRRTRTTAAADSRPGHAAERCVRTASVRSEGLLDAAERQIVELIGRGIPSRAIAVRLGMSVGTVDSHRRRIRSKLNFPTATQLVQFCVQCAAREGAPGSLSPGRS